MNCFLVTILDIFTVQAPSKLYCKCSESLCLVTESSERLESAAGYPAPPKTSCCTPTHDHVTALTIHTFSYA